MVAKSRQPLQRGACARHSCSPPLPTRPTAGRTPRSLQRRHKYHHWLRHRSRRSCRLPRRSRYPHAQWPCWPVAASYRVSAWGSYTCAVPRYSFVDSVSAHEIDLAIERHTTMHIAAVGMLDTCFHSPVPGSYTSTVLSSHLGCFRSCRPCTLLTFEFSTARLESCTTKISRGPGFSWSSFGISQWDFDDG